MVSVFRVGCPLHPMEHSEHREHTQHSRAQRAQLLTYNYMFLNDFFGYLVMFITFHWFEV